MAYSTLKITFHSVPNIGEVLNISETKLGLNLNEIFKESRVTAGEVEIPVFYEYDGVHPPRRQGYISINYKSAFNIDYNSSNLFTVTSTNGDPMEGTGEVIITANYASAVFVLGTSNANLTVVITNEAYTAPAAGVITFTPTAINFKHEQNTAFETVGIAIAGDLWKVVGKPNFVFASQTAGVTVATVTDGSGTYQTVSGSGSAIVSVTPTNYYDRSGTFSASDLSGSFAVLKNNQSYSSIAWSMEVTRLSDFVTIPYVSGDKAFTLDPKFFEFSSTNLDTYFQFDSIIKTYDFFTNEVNEFLIPLKIVLFRGKAKENLGQIIHRLMQKFIAVNDIELQYKEAILKFSCSEILIADGSIIRSGTSADISFIAGLSGSITDIGFLDFNPGHNRVTKNSFAYLNMLVPAGNYELRVFKNGSIQDTIALAESAGSVLCKKVFFSAYEKGDLIQYVVDVVGEDNAAAPRKTYILFPDNNHSNMIVWENEFLVQSAMECTGTALIDTEGEFQSQTIYVDMVEQLEHLSSSKNVKLFIDTGWLLFSDIDTVESLMRSKRAWLIRGDNTISLRPISKKLPQKDLEKELISFPLEFKINPKYDEETYSL